MAWYDVLNGNGFRTWIQATASGTQIPQGQRLDPFQTSWRNLKYTASWLTEIEQHQPLSASDPSQRIADMAAAQLVRSAAADVALTDLGTNALQRWRDAAIDTAADEDELPRCLVLVQEALNLHVPIYENMIGFWRELREVYEADALLASPEGLYLLSYLNRNHGDYNPWHVLRSTKVSGVTQRIINWNDIKAGTPNLDRAIEVGIDNLARRIESAASRSSGRINFCSAMELFLLDPVAARAAIDRWRLPERTKDRCRAVLPTIPVNLTTIDPIIRSSMTLLFERYNVILYGPPGTGKTHHAFGIADAWQAQFGLGTVFRTTFHPSYGYEDFVQGYRPDENNPAVFVRQGGVLLLASEKAAELKRTANHGHIPKVLLLIDEINRGDVSRIFGELITYIEPDKRNIAFFMAQSPKTPFAIPENLFLLGTMNTADKSISLLDVALRRRFAFVEFPPDSTFFARTANVLETVDTIKLGALLQGLNERLEREGIEIDRSIGHALLRIPDNVPNPIDALRRRFEYDIYPLVVEYCYTDRSRIRHVLGGLVDDAGRIKPGSELDDSAFLRILSSISRSSTGSFGSSDESASQPNIGNDAPDEGGDEGDNNVE